MIMVGMITVISHYAFSPVQYACQTIDKSDHRRVSDQPPTSSATISEMFVRCKLSYVATDRDAHPRCISGYVSAKTIGRFCLLVARNSTQGQDWEGQRETLQKLACVVNPRIELDSRTQRCKYSPGFANISLSIGGFMLSTRPVEYNPDISM